MDTQKETVCVIGLGKIGLTLSAVFANSGFNVLGADINQEAVDTINKGLSHISNEPGLPELVHQAHQNRTLTATTKTVEAVGKASVILVIVPVLISEKNEVDYRFIDNAVEEIGKGIQKGTLVIFETTIPTGDSRQRFGRRIEEISGLKMGDDFFLAYSPERVYSNRIIEDLQKYPKVVGGLNKESLQKAVSFYKKAIGCELIEVSSLETAEFSKVAECVYRDVNIALANELAVFADQQGVNIMEAITASNSQPFSHIHLPGIGVGGHCIPIYPYFFINKGLTSGVTQMAREINDSMAEYALLKIEREIGTLQGKKILILGLSFRENVKETTKSSALLLLEHLSNKEAQVFVNDPQFTASEISGFGAIPVSLNEEQKLSEAEIVIIQAYHKEYEQLDFNLFKHCKVLMDGRNVIRGDRLENTGIKHLGIGM